MADYVKNETYSPSSNAYAHPDLATGIEIVYSVAWL